MQKNKLVYYDKTTRKVSKTIKEKAIQFIKKNKVSAIDINHFVVRPIEGYNHNSYSVYISNDMKSYDCNCQGFKKNGFCSHILACMLLYF